jgi:hypothetical protein
VKVLDLTGKQFGDWTVVNRASAGREKGTRWLCRCGGCGRERAVLAGHLVNGQSQGCGCSRDRRNQTARFKGAGKIHKSYYTRIKRSATSTKRRALDFEVSIEFLWELFECQNGRCALTGIPLTFPETMSTASILLSTASLDRIDSSEGYVEGNVQWVHKHVNLMKNRFDQNYFIQLCRRIADFHSIIGEPP